MTTELRRVERRSEPPGVASGSARAAAGVAVAGVVVAAARRRLLGAGVASARGVESEAVGNALSAVAPSAIGARVSEPAVDVEVGSGVWTARRRDCVVVVEAAAAAPAMESEAVGVTRPGPAGVTAGVTTADAASRELTAREEVRAP